MVRQTKTNGAYKAGNLVCNVLSSEGEALPTECMHTYSY